MNATEKIKAFIGHEEALCLKYMNDDGVSAGGFSHHDKGVPLGTPISMEEALELLDKDCRVIDIVLGRVTAREIPQNQHDALVSLAYNIGPNAIARSPLMKQFNLGDLDGVCTSFLTYEHPPRRQREINILKEGDYGTLTGNIIPVYKLDTYSNPHGRFPDEWIPWPRSFE